MPWNPERTSVPSSIRRAVIDLYDGECQVCFGARCGNLRLEVDHRIPVSAGGTDDFDNLRPVGANPCHREKSEAERLRGLAKRSPLRPREPHPGFA